MSFKSSIQELVWDKFPLEYKSYHATYIYKDKPINSIINYLKIIFPSNIIEFNQPEEHIKDKEHAFIIDLSKNIKLTWDISMCVNEKNHIIVIGKYDDISKSILTTSDLIIFDDNADFKKYCEKYKYLGLNDLPENVRFCITNKDRDYKIFTINNNFLEKYE